MCRAAVVHTDFEPHAGQGLYRPAAAACRGAGLTVCAVRSSAFNPGTGAHASMQARKHRCAGAGEPGSCGPDRGLAGG